MMMNFAPLAIFMVHSAYAVRDALVLEHGDILASSVSHAGNLSRAAAGSRLIAGTRLLQGTIIGNRYRLHSRIWPASLTEYTDPNLLGGGAFGQAFMATDTETDTTVVVKLFTKENGALLTTTNAGADDAHRLFLARRECLAAQYVQRARNCGPCRARWMKCIHNGVEDTRAA